jgi:hypothetical protein
MINMINIMNNVATKMLENQNFQWMEEEEDEDAARRRVVLNAIIPRNTTNKVEKNLDVIINNMVVKDEEDPLLANNIK